MILKLLAVMSSSRSDNVSNAVSPFRACEAIVCLLFVYAKQYFSLSRFLWNLTFYFLKRHLSAFFALKILPIFTSYWYFFRNLNFCFLRHHLWTLLYPKMLALKSLAFCILDPFRHPKVVLWTRASNVHILFLVMSF